MGRSSFKESSRPLWLPLLAIGTFTACVFLQLSSVSWVRSASKEAHANDGRESTFFAVHSEPYPVFSEDFHLYHLRAKRILERGWKGSLLYRDDSLPDNYAAPFQVLISLFALVTGGGATGYSLFTAALLFLSWGLLYLIADRYFPPSVSRATILGAVLGTVIYQAPSLVAQEWESSLWYTGRMFRTATYAWSNPMLLSVLILAARLAFERAVKSADLLILAALLVFLAGSDARSFLPAILGTGFVAGGKAAWVAWCRLSGGRRARQTEARSWLILGALVLITLGFHRFLFSSIAGDAFARAGVGEPWLHSPGRFRFDSYIFLQWWASVRGASAAILALVLMGVWWARSQGFRFLGVLSALTAATGFASLFALSSVGIRAYCITPLFHRLDFLLLFLLLALGGEAAWSVLRFALANGSSARRERWTTLWSVLVGSALLPVLGHFNSGLGRYVQTAGARSLALTRDAEALRDWLKALPNQGEGLTIATLSHELNYLMAYWTRADLLLPEGFPLHNLQSDAAIVDRLVGILRIYRVTAEKWDAFDLREHPYDQKTWYDSRAKSGMQGFSYYVFHMALFLDADHYSGNPYHQRVRNGLVWASGPTPHADLILLEEVSEAAGSPDLSRYELAFQHGKIQVWRLRASS